MGHEQATDIPPYDELSQMSRKQLQVLAKMLGVKANAKSKVIIEEIDSMREEVNEEEHEASEELVGESYTVSEFLDVMSGV